MESRAARIAEVLVVLSIALGARLFQLDHVPHKDELNHVLAARALLENGTLEIVPGGQPYERAWGFTYLIAGLFRFLGESLVVGRLVAVVAGAVLVAVLFLWVRAEGGRVGAWVAALLLAFAPISIQLSQWVRFYTPHALLFLAGCLLLYRLFARSTADPRRTVITLVGVVLCFGIAIHVHNLTVVGLAGLGLWAALAAPPWITQRFRKRSHRFVATGMAAGVALVVIGWLGASGVGQSIMQLAGYAPAWAQGSADDIRYYHQIFLLLYGPLWTLFPLAALLALAFRPKPALLALCVFGVAFVTHSLVAWKQERYIFYALPFFFALWGIALGSVLPWLESRLRAMLSSGPARALSPRWRTAIARGLLVGVAAFAALGTPAVSYGHKMLTVPDSEWRWGTYRGEPNWRAAASRLGPAIAEADVVLASHDIAALHGIGRVDYVLRYQGSGAAMADELRTAWRTQVPAISSPGPLETVMRCYGSGIVLIERGHWRNPGMVTPAISDFLESNATMLELPEGWRLVAYSWASPIGAADPEACAGLTARYGGG